MRQSLEMMIVVDIVMSAVLLDALKPLVGFFRLSREDDIHPSTSLQHLPQVYPEYRIQHCFTLIDVKQKIL